MLDYAARARAAPPAWAISLAELRAGPEAEAEALWGSPPAALFAAHDITIQGPAEPMRLRVYRPADDTPLPALVWFHGGGWVVGSIESHDLLCRELAARAGCCVISVGYRLAPEHPFPAAIDDAWAGLTWAARSADELGFDPTKIAVGGDSAGGNLAAVVALRARDEGLPLALQVLAYPVTDAEFGSPTYVRHGDGLNLTRAKMRWYWSQYLAGADPTHAAASPMRAHDLRGVAPALVQTAEYDPLCWEGEAYAGRLLDAGVEVTLTRYEGTIHGFLRMPGLTAKAVCALSEIAARLSA